jgi:hypothetical protein
MDGMVSKYEIQEYQDPLGFAFQVLKGKEFNKKEKLLSGCGESEGSGIGWDSGYPGCGVGYGDSDGWGDVNQNGIGWGQGQAKGWTSGKWGMK